MVANKNLINFLKIFVFLNGASITALEITASRVLAPYFGTSLPVWGSIIGITLVSLAIGYSLGGKVANEQLNLQKLGFLTLIAGILASIIPLISKPILQFLLDQLLAVNFVVIIGSLLASISLFALPIIIMGMVSPITVYLATKKREDVGQVAGSLYSLATIGSIIGVFIPSFFTIPILGSRETILIFAFIEILISLLAIKKIKYTLVLILIALSALQIEAVDPKAILEIESPYQFIRIKQKDDIVELKFNEGTGTQSIYDLSRSLKIDRYWDYVVLFPYFQANKVDQKMLIIGVAGATAATNIRDHNSNFKFEITGLEIDPKVRDLAEKYFAVDNVNFLIADGRVGLNQINKKFDLVMIDAYTQQNYIPAHLVTKEFFQEVNQKLDQNGSIVANINARNINSPLLQAIAHTLDSVYANVWIFKVPNTYNYWLIASNRAEVFADFQPDPKFQNLISVAKNAQKYYGSGLLLTDNRSPLELLTDIEFYKEINLRD